MLDNGGYLITIQVADGTYTGAVVLRSFETWVQLASVDGQTLRAPEGQMDDRAIAYALCVVGLPQIVSAVPWKLIRF